MSACWFLCQFSMFFTMLLISWINKFCYVCINPEVYIQKQPFKIDVLKKFVIFRRKHVLVSLFNKVECLKACYFMKKRIRQSCFPVNIAKYLIASFIEHHRMLLLYFFEVSPGELFFRLPKKNWRTLNKYYQENWTYQFFCISRLLRRPTSNKFWHKKINHKGALGKLLYFMVLFGLF